MMEKCSVLHEEVIDVFHINFYITTIEKLLFYHAHDIILGSMECGRTRNDCFHARKLWKLYESFFPFRTWSKNKKLKNPFTNVIFKFQSTCDYNLRGHHICQPGDIPS